MAAFVQYIFIYLTEEEKDGKDRAATFCPPTQVFPAAGTESPLQEELVSHSGNSVGNHS